MRDDLHASTALLSVAQAFLPSSRQLSPSTASVVSHMARSPSSAQPRGPRQGLCTK
ncbi:MAG: hypothetical protein QM756_27650 [Polyangiaceae bacterium]